MVVTSKNTTITSSAQTVALTQEATRLVLSTDTDCYITLNLNSDASPAAVTASAFLLPADAILPIHSITPVSSVQVIGTAGKFSVLAYA
jgi:hypothetical protein